MKEGRKLAVLALVTSCVLAASCSEGVAVARHEGARRHDGVAEFLSGLPPSLTVPAPSSVRREGLIAPSGAIAGERPSREGVQVLRLGHDGPWGPALRVDAESHEHVGFRLDISPPTAHVEMEVLAWDGDSPVSLGMTNWGPGLRVLSAMDPFGARTFWVRARGTIPSGSMTVTRTRIERGPRCRADCARLLQLPLPVDPGAQGYEIAPSSVFAYQFGRRDLLMALFNAGFDVADAQIAPFQVKRLSRWDGGQPPSHRSHLGGVDVDISLYTETGERVWYPLCRDAGQRCVRATRWNFGEEQMALLIAGFFESGLFAEHGDAGIFIDREFHSAVRRGASELLERERITTQTHALFAASRRTLRHVEPHHHHVHLRVGGGPSANEL